MSKESPFDQMYKPPTVKDPIPEEPSYNRLMSNAFYAEATEQMRKILRGESSHYWEAKDLNLHMFDIMECACGGTNLHQINCILGWRAEDDEATVVESSSRSAVVSVSKSRVWMGRRSSMGILFACETCPHPSVVTIQQHKGSTFFKYYHLRI